MHVHWTVRIERCDAILLVGDLFGLTPKSRHDLCEQAAECVNKAMTIFMRSEQTTGYPLMNNIAWCMWMTVSSITMIVLNFPGFQMAILWNDLQGKGGVGVLCTPSWKKVCERTPSACLRQSNPKEMPINRLIPRFSSNGFRSSCCHLFPSDVCL